MLEIPNWDKEYAGEPFLEYFTVGLLRGVVYQGLMHKEEAVPHLPLVEIVNIMEEKGKSFDSEADYVEVGNEDSLDITGDITIEEPIEPMLGVKRKHGISKRRDEK